MSNKVPFSEIIKACNLHLQRLKAMEDLRKGWEESIIELGPDDEETQREIKEWSEFENSFENWLDSQVGLEDDFLKALNEVTKKIGGDTPLRPDRFK